MIGGRYRLLSRLGAGGAGVVWRAEDTLLRRSIAIKEVQPSGDGERDDMLREARAAARLDHPGAVTVYDVVHDAGRDYIVMQLVDGPNLAEEVAERGPLDECTSANLGLRLLDVVEAAHDQGLIHRDIKPANVMFPGDGRAQLTDFGIARLMDDPRHTTTGLVRGTPQYMSPEQAAGGHIGPATDMWSLGATLYFAMEGVAPFDKGQALATLNAITVEPPRPPLRAGPLEDVLQSLLTKDPEARARAAEVRRRLRAVADSGAPTRELLEPWAAPAPARPAPVAPSSHPDGEALDSDDAPVVPFAAAPGGPPAPASWPAESSPSTTGDEAVTDRWPAAAPAPLTDTPEPPEPPEPTFSDRRAASEAAVGRRAEAELPAVAGSPIAARRHDEDAWKPHGHPAVARGRRTAWRWALPVALLLAILVAAAVAVSTAGGGSKPSPRPSAGSGSRAAAPSSPGTAGPPASSGTHPPSGGGSGASPPAVPADWATYTDPQVGFRLRYPPGWKVSSEGLHTTFTDTATGDYLLIDHQTPPASTPQGPWYSNEPGFAANHAGYQRIGDITTTTFHGYPAALWEYEYNSGSDRLHAIDLGMIVGSNGYAFNFQASEARWSGDQQEVAQLEAGFAPAG